MAGCAAGAAGLAVNYYIKHTTEDKILTAYTQDKSSLSEEETEALREQEADCILILGAGIQDDETPTPMLKDRLDAGIDLYWQGVAPKVLLTGDNGTASHNEIHVMLNYTLDAGVPEEDIFCDHAGFSTYDSMYRAKEIFGAESVIVVTQTYHEYRSLYIADRLGISAVGAAADQERYAGQFLRDFREILARVKDFIKVSARPESEIGGEAIPISGNGIISHGE
ncbi:MAG: ElyC/SanA/YdcF family protein [Lachnospiraceae bacterium]|nr:ElyC/SanA/YdcF family protein [Lachnospiraceae bacterium]